MTISVLLVDDHHVLTEGLVYVLSGFDDITIAGTARGGAQAVELYGELAPDIVLMDLSMPDVDGVEATRRIRELDPDAGIIALTGFIDDALVRGALDAGVRGYLLKSVSGSDLVQAIRAVAAGGSVLSNDALRRIGRTNHTKTGFDLTKRELDVLTLLVRGLTNQQIADELGLRHGTVRIHVSHVLTKLQVKNRTSAARVALAEQLVTGIG